MSVSSTTIKSLCNSGCNIVVDYKKYSLETLKVLASTVNVTGGHLTLKRCYLASSSTALQTIAELGKSSVTFDFSADTI